MRAKVPSWEPKRALKCPSFRPCPSKSLCTPLPTSIYRVCVQQNGSDEPTAVHSRCPKWETEKCSAAKKTKAELKREWMSDTCTYIRQVARKSCPRSVWWIYKLCIANKLKHICDLWHGIITPLPYWLEFVPFAQCSPEKPIHDPQRLHHVHAV